MVIGATVDVQEVAYDSVAGPEEIDAVEGYLRRYVFDDSIALDRMRSIQPLAGCLAGWTDGTG